MKKIALPLLLVSMVYANYTHALDFRTGGVWNPSVDSLMGSFTVQGFYNSVAKLDNGFYIPTDLRLMAYTLPPLDDRIGTPVEKFTTPNSFLGYTGLGWGESINFQARGYYRLNSGNRQLTMPWSPSQQPEYLYGRFTENYHTGFDLNIRYPHERFQLQLYSMNIFANQSYYNDSLPELNVENSVDKDWWFDIDGSVHVIDKKLMVVGELVHKNDLTDVADYNFTTGSIGIGTDLKIGRKWHLWGDLSGQFYDNVRMSERGYLNDGGWADNIGVRSNIRTFLALKKRLYIKGDMRTDISNKMTKIRYDMAVRKVWKKSAITSQLGFWSTPGSLFPQSCTYYSGSFGLTDQMTILPQVKFYMQWDNETEEYTYNHTDLGLELNFELPDQSSPIFTRLTILGGVDYQMFDEETLFFSNQISAYIGVRTQL